jgi:hypothetical protein
MDPSYILLNGWAQLINDKIGRQAEGGKADRSEWYIIRTRKHEFLPLWHAVDACPISIYVSD